MKQQIWQMTLGIAALVALMGGAVADSEFLMHGRVSFDTGTAMVKNATEDNWSAAVVNTLVMPGDTLWVDQSGTAEVELAGASFLRLADGSKAEVVSLPPNAYIRGWAGSFYVHRLTRSQGDFVFTTPSATVEVPADALVRVDIDASGAATVSVRYGSAKVRTDHGGDVTATESTRVWVDPGMLPSEATPFDRAQTDAFDTWNNERTQLLAQGVRSAPKDVVIQETTVGRYDLDRYGEWVYVDSRPYWRPTVVVDYVPYRHGYWNHMPSVGHVWVDEYPFAYVTTHYGRWRHVPTYGWLWSYDPVWSPAWVASVRVGDYYAWSPVDYYNRPVLVTGASVFSLGGVSFCSYSTSYVRHSYLYAGPSYVYAPTTVIINTFNAAPPRSVNVWNVAYNQRSRPSVPYDSRFIAGERDYNPRRSIRGAQGDWVKDQAPSDRARRLEAGLGRTEFASAASRSTEGRSLRTSATEGARVAGTRQVRLGQTEQTYMSRSARTSGESTTSRPQLVPESSRLASLGERSGGSLRAATPGQESIRSRSDAPTPQTGRSTLGETPSMRSGQTNLRSATPTTGSRTSATAGDNASGRVALRDMESSVPAPRTGIMPERTTIRSNSGTSSPRTSQPSASTTPAPTVRRDSTPTTQRSAPAPTPTPTVRRESTPIQRSAPAPAPTPTVRRDSTPIQRSAPAPTPAPTVRRSVPAPSPAPTVQRSAPAPTVQRSAPAPSPAPTVRRSAPAPAPTTNRSFSTPPSSSRSSAPSTRSLPSSGISSSPRPSMPSSSSSSRLQRSAPSSGSSSRGRR
jgi:hypothetical protein